MSEASQKRYLSCISEQFPTVQSLYTEIINLKAILNLPKGTEHFMSDIHGEYDAFLHILNNCSGVVREKALLLFSSTHSAAAISDLLTLIYYPKEKLKLLGAAGRLTKGWYNGTLHDLIELSRLLSSKYTRSKVRKAMPSAYAYILDELLHALPDEDDNQLVYHQKIIDALIDIGSGDEFIVALCGLIKRLAVDRLHIVGDIYDRGPHADGIMDLLVDHHAVDINGATMISSGWARPPATPYAWPPSYADVCNMTTWSCWKPAMASACGRSHCLPARTIRALRRRRRGFRL